MNKPKKQCKIEDCESQIFGLGLCLYHYKIEKSKTAKSLKRSPLKKISEKGIEKKKEKAILTDLQFKMFKEVYDETPIKKCYECNYNVDGKSSGNFHHLLYKSQFPQFRLEKWNIIITCLNCHSQTHLDIKKTPRIEKLTEIIKEKYNK